MNHNGKSRDELAREANQVRTKLLRTVEELDRRRHEALDIRAQLHMHVRQLLLFGGVLVVATAGAVALVVQRISTSGQRRRRDRWRLAKRVWHHPERTLRGERRSFFGELARSILLAIASAAVTLPVKRAVMHFLEPGEGREGEQAMSGASSAASNRSPAH
jgi:hypothetical protein